MFGTIQTTNSSTPSTVNGSGLPFGFKKREGGAIMDCHNQWKNRPADEAVFNVSELLDRTKAARIGCSEREGIEWGSLEVLPTMRGDLALTADGQIAPALLNNYSLAQLCNLPGDEGGIAPASFLTKLSADTAATVLNERLRSGVQRKNQASLLVQAGASGKPATLRSITTEAYERVWDHDLALRVSDLCDRGTWGPAQAFKQAGGRTFGRAWGDASNPLPLGWVGDRSMFVALVDYDGSIRHEGNEYSRFFLLSNSEVGAGSLKITFGLLDFVCCNFILWGCQEVYEANFRHTKSIHERWAALSSGLTRSLAAENRDTIVGGINAARARLLGETSEDVIKVVQAKTALPKGIVSDAYQRALATPRYGDARSVWGMINGLTEASQAVTQNADKRLAIDTKAASLMALAA